jgi:DNA-directed RNA polymerase subunit K/omega
MQGGYAGDLNTRKSAKKPLERAEWEAEDGKLPIENIRKKDYA